MGFLDIHKLSLNQKSSDLSLSFASKAVICIILFTLFIGKAAGGNDIYHIPPPPPTTGGAVSFNAVISADVEAIEAIFLYKMNGQQSYNELEMEILGNTWTATIPIIPDGDNIEYFFLLRQQDGSEIKFPENNPYILSVTPRIESESSLKDSEAISTTQDKNNFLILSPDENDIVYSDAVLIMVSIYNIPDVDISSVHFYLDGEDVTTKAFITSDLVTFAPAKVDPGFKRFTITASTNDGSTIAPLHQTISVISSEKSKLTNFSYSVNGNSGISLDQVEDETLNIGLTNLSIRGRWPWLKFKSRFKITTEESQFKQPKNRYSATFKTGKFLKVNLGDFTPSISPYTINGKRIRGIGTEWRLGWLKFQSVRGELERSTQGLYDADKAYRVSNVFIDTTGRIVYELDRRGYTFKNNLTSYRFALNIRDKIIFGSTIMMVKNDINSVVRELPEASFTISPFIDSSIDVMPLDSGIFTFSEFQNTVDGNNNLSYQLAEKGWSGNKPQQNLVVGTDFRFSLNEQKFLLEGYWALSFLNKDIWDGAMTLAELDTLMGDSQDGQIFGQMDTASLPNPADLEDYMTINMNMVPIIPIDINLIETDPMKAVMNMPSVAYNLKLRTLYFGNLFEIQYSQVGPEFTSLANPYFPKNTREFSVIDKFWLFKRRLQTSFNYKVKTNDILETNTNPYNEQTTGINLNFMPGIDLPTAMYGHKNIIRTNSTTDIDTLFNSDSTTYDLRDLRIDFITTNRLFTVNLPMKRNNASYWVGGTFNSIVGTDQLEKERSADDAFISQASTMHLLSLILGARYQTGLKLLLNISNFTNELTAQGKTELNGLSITGGYPLNNKINLSGTLSYLSSSGLSEFSNYGLSLGSTLKISKSFRVNLAASTKARSSTTGTEISNLALKLSTNYKF